MVSRPLRLLACAACSALAGCTLITDSFRSNDFSGDPYPIYVGRESGAVLIGVRDSSGQEHDAVLDVLSPLTVIDPGVCMPQSLVTSDLTLLGRSSLTDNDFDVPRARLRSADVAALHPCPEPDDCAQPQDTGCSIGRPDGVVQGYSAIVGASSLAGDALRLRLGDSQVFIVADIGGGERDRTYVCDAVFPSPYRGGGTLVIAGTEVPFGGRRVTLQACLGDDPDLKPIMTGSPPTSGPLPQPARGGDALLVMSTGIGISLLSEPAYERYRQASLLQAMYGRPSAPPMAPPPLDQLSESSAYLPSGLVSGRRALIDRLALAAAASSSTRAPCRQAYAHEFLLQNKSCTRAEGEDCPCTGTDKFCAVPGIVKLAPTGGVEVLVVPDGDPTLQALRAELRPDQPEVDGILGADALELAEIDVDYPHDRVLMRCTAPQDQCQTRPALASQQDCVQVSHCIGVPSWCVPTP